MEKNIKVKDLGNNYYEVIAKDTSDGLVGNAYLQSGVCYYKRPYETQLVFKFYNDDESPYGVVSSDNLQVVFEFLNIKYFDKELKNIENMQYSIHDLLEMAENGKVKGE
jgi:hypothetical protein